MNEKLIFRILLAVWIALTLIVRGYYQFQPRGVQDHVELKESPLNIWLRSAVGLLGFIALGVYLIVPQWMGWSALPLPTSLREVGAALGICSVGLLLWVHRALAENFSGMLRTREHQEMVIAGPYAWVRHPICSTFYLLVFSFLFLSSNWLIGLIWIGAPTGVMVSRVGREEQSMIAQFGDAYRTYLQTTPRFVSKLIA